MNDRALARLVPFAAAGLGIGCGATAPRPPVSVVSASHVVAPPGSDLVTACTPTGAELCFNAIDDNCNGIIDEGCGEPTGVLQLTIAWGASPADVNLTLVTPEQDRVPNARVRSTPSGFHADRDCPGDDGCAGQSVENVYFDGLEPPRGHYVAEISLGELHGAEVPVHVRFGARLGARVVGFDVDVAPGEDATKTFAFELP